MENRHGCRTNRIIFGWLGVTAAFAFFGLGDLSLYIRIGSFSLATIASVVFTILYIFVLLWHKRLHKISFLLFVPYAVWLMYALANTLISQAFTKNALQNFFSYLAFGTAILYSANLRYRNPMIYAVSLNRSLAFIDLVTLSLFFVNFFLFGWGSDVVGSNWLVAPRSLAIFALLPLAHHLSRFVVARNFHAVWMSSLWLAAIIVSLSRTALVTAILMIALALILARIQLPTRLLWMVLVTINFGAAVWWIFNTSNPLRDRFTLGDAAVAVGGVSINTSGRMNIWRVVWNSAQKNLLFGRGIGSSEIVVAQQLKGLAHPHNDYLRILHDIGLIGLAIFIIQQIIWASWLYRNYLKTRTKQPEAQIPVVVALLTLFGMLITMITDNTLAYTFILIPFGLIIGGGFVLRTRQ